MNNSSMQSIRIPGASNFKFSAVRPEDLGATEYTLVNIVVDSTSSVYGFSNELKSAVLAVISASRQSPRADNLLIRLTTFNTEISESFGFKSLNDITTNYIQDIQPNGMTALYDATYDAITAVENYAGILYQQDFDSNAAVYVITDGCDNHSKSVSPESIAKKIDQIRADEQLESILTLLIGVNTQNGGVKNALADYARKAKFSQYIDVGEANAKTLAKLAGFVSKSISNQSQALGSGSASQSLTF